MKRCNSTHGYHRANKHEKWCWKNEQNTGGFTCRHCKRFVPINTVMGTTNRNHCAVCLWSRHVDNSKGDRLATCHGGMKPIGLTFKHEGYDRQGELMLIHLCSLCSKLSINRIARDDDEMRLLEVFERSIGLGTAVAVKLQCSGIRLLTAKDRKAVYLQLYGHL